MRFNPECVLMSTEENIANKRKEKQHQTIPQVILRFWLMEIYFYSCLCNK